MEVNIHIVKSRVTSILRTMPVEEQARDHKANSLMQVQMKATQIFSRILKRDSTPDKNTGVLFQRSSAKIMAAKKAVTNSEIMFICAIHYNLHNSNTHLQSITANYFLIPPPSFSKAVLSTSPLLSHIFH